MIPGDGAIASQGFARARLITAITAVALLMPLVLGGIGYGGSSDPAGSSASGPARGPQPASFFSPLAPPASPNTVWHQVANRLPAPTGQTAGFDQYFYIVNGILADGSPLPTGSSGPLPSNPLVLTVSGQAPYGATSPNGGTTVTVAPISSAVDGSQLWKAVAAPNSNNMYLRSAQSFAVTQVDNRALTLLGVGPAAPGMALDLGYLADWGSAIYSNQESSPTGDNSTFQQWSYNPATAQLTNLNADGQLYNSRSGGAVGVGPQAPAAANQWYIYPSYFVGAIVNEPNSNPPFPAAADAGQAAAYDYISNQLAVSNVTCNYEGTAYTGIRCEYEFVTTSSALSNCYVEVTTAKPPIEYEGTPISLADWSAVKGQIANECSYAVGVQNTFSNYNSIFSYVFNNSGDQIPTLLKDVAVSSSTKLNNAVPIELIEGILYTLLNAVDKVGAGVVANLMSAAVNTALAVPQNTLNDKLLTTAGDLYGDLSNSYQQVNSGALSAEGAILQDWGRLRQIGPATNISGYNGLALTTDDVQNLEGQMLNAYKLTIMQQLMPEAYDLWVYIANLGTPSGLNTTDYNHYRYSTFGSYDQNNNLGTFWKVDQGDPDGNKFAPSLQVMKTDIFDNGANPFEVFNGLNGWNQLTVDSDCCTLVNAITLFNATATDFSLSLVPTENSSRIALPTVDGVTSKSAFDNAELRPYGYITLYAIGNAEVGVFIPQGNNIDTHVGNFNVTATGGHADSMVSGTANATAGFNFSPVGSRNGGGGPGGVWTTIYQ